MNKLWHTCTNKAKQRVLTWSTCTNVVFFFELTLTSFQEPETGVGHLHNIPVPTNVTSEYGSGLSAEATVVQLIHFLTSLQNLLVFWKIYSTFNKYCKKSNLHHNSNTRPVTYQANALTAELTRPDELNVAHLLIRWQTKSSCHLHNAIATA